ncbi:MAG: heparinase II/III family protein [Armatimonas sp.]
MRQETLLSTLRKGHPRLLAREEDLARVKGLIAREPGAKVHYEALKKAGEGLLTFPDTVEYVLIGPRLLTQSRRALDRVSRLGFLYLLDGDTHWVERAKKELFAAAAFPDWNPSHFLDVAEMTAAFAIGYDWLQAALSESERKLIREAIVEKGLKQGLLAYAGKGKGTKWPTAKHNWNQVCNGGMILGALVIADEEPALAAEILTNARKSLPNAMASFAPDGGWAEGPGYWAYTLQYTAFLCAALTSALGTDFDISKAQGFERTGLFRTHFCGPTGVVFNYADGGETRERSPSLRWLARRFNQPDWDFIAEQAAPKSENPLDLLWYAPPPNRAPVLPVAERFKGVDVALMRSAWGDKDALWVGFKGGDNAANHSHLDLGTFVFEALGERWFIELGGDNYNLPAYFGKERWNYYRLRTEGQNCITLDAENQNPKAKAPLIAFTPTRDGGSAAADLTAGYAPKAASYKRTVALDRESLSITDALEAPMPADVLWRVHTQAQVAISTDGRQATLTRNGKAIYAVLEAPAEARFTVEEAVIPPVPNSKEQPKPLKDTRRLMVALPRQTRLNLKVRFTVRRVG